MPTYPASIQTARTGHLQPTGVCSNFYVSKCAPTIAQDNDQSFYKFESA